jgi:hypothetical protein
LLKKAVILSLSHTRVAGSVPLVAAAVPAAVSSLRLASFFRR